MSNCLECDEFDLAVRVATDEAIQAQRIGGVEERNLIAVRDAQRIHNWTCPERVAKLESWLIKYDPFSKV